MENNYDSFLGLQLGLVASIYVYQKMFSCSLAGVRIVSGKLSNCSFKHLFRIQAVWDLSKRELPHIAYLHIIRILEKFEIIIERTIKTKNLVGNLRSGY